MKILIYSKDFDLVKESGVGKAISHQIKALELVGADFTLDENEDHDVCHINTVLPDSPVFAMRESAKGIKVVYHAHSTEEDFKNSFLFSNVLASGFKQWLKFCYNLGDLILTPSEYSKKLLETYELKRPIEVISNGIDLNFWQKKEGDRENFYERYGLDENKKSVVSVGLFIKRKGILDFVELAKTFPEYEFVWFGNLNLKLVPEEISEAISTKLDNLHFPGYAQSELIREAYCASDLYFFPTHEETEGIVLLEAMACKAEILLRDIEIFNYLEEGKDVYKADSLDGFKEKLSGILEGRLPALKGNPYRIVEEKSLEKIGHKLLDLYEKAYNS